MSQTIILSLKECKKLTISPQSKIKILLKIYFSFLSKVFMNDVKESFYFLLTDDNNLFINRKITKIVYKANLIKISKVNKIINRALHQLINIVVK